VMARERAEERCWMEAGAAAKADRSRPDVTPFAGSVLIGDADAGSASVQLSL